MALKQRPVSSGSDGEMLVRTTEERKRKRMLSNRESSRRARIRKQKQLDDLISQEFQIKNANKQLVERINMMVQQYNEIQSASNVLTAQIMDLTERLLYLNSVLRIVEEASGLPMDIPEIPDHLTEPWMLPCAAQPVATTANIFNVDQCL